MHINFDPASRRAQPVTKTIHKPAIKAAPPKKKNKKRKDTLAKSSSDSLSDSYDDESETG